MRRNNRFGVGLCYANPTDMTATEESSHFFPKGRCFCKTAEFAENAEDLQDRCLGTNAVSPQIDELQIDITQRRGDAEEKKSSAFIHAHQLYCSDECRSASISVPDF